MVSIAAFQAVDPGSFPGRLIDFNFLLREPWTVKTESWDVVLLTRWRLVVVWCRVVHLRLYRSFLQNLLTCFGFGPSFCNWVNTFYKGANIRAIVNEWLTEPIPLSRGVGFTCPPRKLLTSRRWYSGEHSCLPSSWPGFDSRPTH